MIFSLLRAGLFWSAVARIAVATLSAIEPPRWWQEFDVTNAQFPDSRAVATVGQAKWMAVRACDALETVLPESASRVRTALGQTSVGSVFPPPLAERTSAWYAEQRSAVNVGQLKSLCKPLYDELNQVGAAEWVTREFEAAQTGETGLYPWTESVSGDDSDFAPALLGHLKAAFFLRFHESFDGDTISDLAEYVRYGGTNQYVPALGPDADSDGLPDDFESAIGSNPTSKDTNGDGLTDGEQMALGEDPVSGRAIGEDGTVICYRERKFYIHSYEAYFLDDGPDPDEWVHQIDCLNGWKLVPPDGPWTDEVTSESMFGAARVRQFGDGIEFPAQWATSTGGSIGLEARLSYGFHHHWWFEAPEYVADTGGSGSDFELSLFSLRPDKLAQNLELIEVIRRGFPYPQPDQRSFGRRLSLSIPPGAQRSNVIRVSGVVSHAPSSPPSSPTKNPDYPLWGTSVSLLVADFDIDSDNNNGLAPPAQSANEETREYKSPSETADPDKPGKILMVNDGDVDADGVPDFADGLDVFEEDGKHPYSGNHESARFVPVILTPAVWSGEYSQARIRFRYDDSDPAQIGRTGLQGNYTYTAAPGHLRLWRRDGNIKRKVASRNQSGDFLPADETFTAGQLDPLGEGMITLYVEAVKRSENIADQSIKVEFDFDGDGTDLDWVEIDAISVTALNFELLKVNPNGSLERETSPVVSHPTPKVSVSYASATVAGANGGTSLIANLTLGGTVDSLVCDATPELDAVIDHASVFVNGAATPVAIIELDVEKSIDPDEILECGSFSATFGASIPSVSLTEGVNTIRVEAADPIYGFIGYAEYAVMVDGRDHAAIRSRALEIIAEFPAAGLSATAVDTIQAHIGLPAAGQPFLTLVETADGSGTPAANSRYFVATNQAWSLRLVGEIQEISPSASGGNSPGKAASFLVTSSATGETFSFPVCVATNGVTFAGVWFETTTYDPEAPYNHAISSPTIWSNGNSGPGDWHPFLAALQGPQDFLGARARFTIDGIAHKLKEWQDAAAGTTYFLFGKEINATDVAPSVLMVKFWGSFTDKTGAIGNDIRDRLRLITLNLPAEDQFKAGVALGLAGGAYSAVEGVGTLGVLALATQIGQFEVALTGEVPITIAIGKQAVDGLVDQVRGAHAIIDKIRSLHDHSQQLALITLLASRDRAALTNLFGAEHVDEVLAHAEMWMLLGEILTEAEQNFRINPPYEAGYYLGRIAFEVILAFIGVEEARLAVAAVREGVKLGQLAAFQSRITKALVLVRIEKRFKYERPDLKDFIASQRVAAEAVQLGIGEMCFAAGTVILTRQGWLPIELIEANDLVWSRDPATAREGWLPVRQTFITQPTRLYHIRYSTSRPLSSNLTAQQGQPESLNDRLALASGITTGGGGDLPTSESYTLSTTGEHPFFVLSAASPGFVQAKDLRPGDQFFLSGGRHAFIASIEIEEAPPGETFTTYNFEVEEFHTYFAGPLGVWVHNSGPNYCGMMMGEMHRIATSRGLPTVVGQRPELLIDVVRNYNKKGIIIPDQEIAWAARKVCEYENRDYLTGGPLTRTYQWWDESFFGRLGVKRRQKGGIGDFDDHHDAENRILNALGIKDVPWAIRDPSGNRMDVPATVLCRHTNSDPERRFGPYHRGAPEGLVERITNEVMIHNDDPRAMLLALRNIYTPPPFGEVYMWGPTRDFIKGELLRARNAGINVFDPTGVPD